MLKTILSLGLVLSTVIGWAQSYDSFEKKELINGGDTLRYRIQYPFGYDAGKKYPLVLLLHGSGERGSDNEAQLKWGGSLFADSTVRAKFPAIVVFPQCQRGDRWSQPAPNQPDSLRFRFRSDTTPTTPLRLVMQLLDDLASSGTVDTKRIYVGGLSMGGMGTYEILWRKPRFFAAAFPICGAGDPGQVRLYARKFPIWIFHGDKDPAVPVANARFMFGVLTASHAKVKYTEYPGVGHDSWKNAFAEPALLPWLFSQKR
jgi:predicted peptidase